MPAPADILNARILIVDDQERGVAVLTNMLQDAGYTSIASTTDPQRVAQLHRQSLFDLIVLDLQMPTLDGFAVMTELEKVEPEGYLSVLAVTGQPSLKMRALRSGAKDFISKPFDPTEVLTRIHNLLEVRLLYQEAANRANYLSHYDALTGLPNRTLFCSSLKTTVRQATKNDWTVSVLVVNIDRFKHINETLGHAAGDQLLKLCADRLRACLRFSDMIARLSGDEFGLILLAPNKPQECGAIATKLRDVLRQPFDLDGHEVTISASIGITLYPLDSRDPDLLLKNSDTAMYSAKKAGRDTYRFYTSQMNTQAIEKLDMESDLRKALAQDQFVLHYQPKISLESGMISGVESLLRWNRPGHGLVAPLDFIPLLEETGLIVSVGAWVIRTVCTQIADWQQAGVQQPRVAVNLSSRQLKPETLSVDPDATLTQAPPQELHTLELETARILQSSAVDPALLEFELTESVLMSHAEESVSILQRLKRLGISLSLDDFGTGFSSLAYLKRFPLDTIKIDRMFIRDVTTNADDAAITLAIIAMAHKLKLRVIAEGVETREQLEFLRTNHCDEAQGYYLSRPIPASDMSVLFLRDSSLVPAT